MQFVTTTEMKIASKSYGVYNWPATILVSRPIQRWAWAFEIWTHRWGCEPPLSYGHNKGFTKRPHVRTKWDALCYSPPYETEEYIYSRGVLRIPDAWTQGQQAIWIQAHIKHKGTQAKGRETMPLEGGCH